MSHALLALLVAAAAQMPDAGTPAPTPQPPATPPAQEQAAPAPAAETVPPAAVEDLRREVDQKVEEAKQSIRAEMATQGLAQGWEDTWVEEQRKLELFTLDGYFRTRPTLYQNFDLGRPADPSGYLLFPRPGTSPNDRTQAGVNMRARLEPTLNISEEVRLRMQIDALDNVVFGSTPSTPYDPRYLFNVFDESQIAPRAGINSFNDAIMVRRAYGEVSTPVGILRFGRMGSHWGLGMMYNDGNCLDCDYGDTVDRIQFVTEPFPGFYVAPMLDFVAEGPVAQRDVTGGEPFDLSNSDDAHAFVLAVARRDTEQQMRAKLDNGMAVFNYGLHFSYRVQRNEQVGFLPTTVPGGFTGDEPAPTDPVYVTRNSSLYVPDLWVKYEKKAFRLELEAAAVLGSIGNRALDAAGANNPALNQSLQVVQFGGVAQGEYRLMDGQLKLQLELGFASGDKAPGFGNRPARRTAAADGETVAGDIDGPQWACEGPGACQDNAIRNFRFDRDYRIDLILFRNIIGGITDTAYAKPTLTYSLAEGFDLYGSIIYSRAIYGESTPSSEIPDLGVELNAGAMYVTDDGFIGGIAYGILFPLGGLGVIGGETPLDNAQTLRGYLGVKF